MEHFTPSFYVIETSKNVKNFVKEHGYEFWKIFKPLSFFIVGCYLFDAVMSDLYFSYSETTFGIGGIIASYFYTCLAISWHRVVINGPDNYVPMNPFKPKKHEFAFVGASFLIGVGFSIIVFIAATLKSPVMIFAMIAVFLVAIYLALRLMFYFPAKAVNAQITLREAYSLSKGYLWKISNACFFASFRLMMLVFLYAIILIIVFSVSANIIMGNAISIDTIMENAMELPVFTIEFIVALPFTLYFQPLITVLSVTVLSNYYLYALRNTA